MALFRNDSPGALTMEQAIARHTARLEQERRRIEAEQKAKAEAAARDKKTVRMAEHVAAEGRGGDTEVAHVTPGEMVIPRVFQTPEVLAALAKVAATHGVPLDRFRVGDARNSINPNTGVPEFIFDDTWHGAVQLPSIRNALANAGNSMLSGADMRQLSSFMKDFDRWAASTPINIDYSGAGLSGIGSKPGVNAPYRYDGPPVGEITVTAPRATNPPQQSGTYSPNNYSVVGGDLRLPDGSTVSENLRRTQRDVELENELAQYPGPNPAGAATGQWIARVFPFGPWDYKHQRGGDDFQGNYNYGATGAAIFPEEALLRAGGAAQMLFGWKRYKSENGVPWGSWPYGDDPVDSSNISAGYAYGQSFGKK